MVFQCGLMFAMYSRCATNKLAPEEEINYYNVILCTISVRTQIIQPPVDTTVLLGLTASLQCKVSSDPTVPFNIDWYREGQRNPIVNSQRVGVQSDGTLEIQAVRASDVDVYSCVVTSPGGNETRSARLSVIELPFPPTNVIADKLDSPSQRAINVSWTPGFDGNSPILKFIIQKREVSELGEFLWYCI